LQWKEIIDFAQEDLADDDVMLLDAYNEVFLWIGSTANKLEREESMAIAESYIAAATDGRDQACPIQKVEAGSEPPMFTAHFIGWLHSEDKPDNSAREKDFATQQVLQEVAEGVSSKPPPVATEWEKMETKRAKEKTDAEAAKASEDARQKELLISQGKSHFENKEAAAKAKAAKASADLASATEDLQIKTEAQRAEWRAQKVCTSQMNTALLLTPLF